MQEDPDADDVHRHQGGRADHGQHAAQPAVVTAYEIGLLGWVAPQPATAVGQSRPHPDDHHGSREETRSAPEQDVPACGFLETADLRCRVFPQRRQVGAGALVAGDQPVPVGVDVHPDVLADQLDVGVVAADERTVQQTAGVLSQHGFHRHRLAGDLDVRRRRVRHRHQCAREGKGRDERDHHDAQRELRAGDRGGAHVSRGYAARPCGYLETARFARALPLRIVTALPSNHTGPAGSRSPRREPVRSPAPSTHPTARTPCRAAFAHGRERTAAPVGVTRARRHRYRRNRSGSDGHHASGGESRRPRRARRCRSPARAWAAIRPFAGRPGTLCRRRSRP